MSSGISLIKAVCRVLMEYTDYGLGCNTPPYEILLIDPVKGWRDRKNGRLEVHIDHSDFFAWATPAAIGWRMPMRSNRLTWTVRQLMSTPASTTHPTCISRANWVRDRKVRVTRTTAASGRYSIRAGRKRNPASATRANPERIAPTKRTISASLPNNNQIPANVQTTIQRPRTPALLRVLPSRP